GVKKVALQVNGETFTGVGVLADGTFQYYAKDKVLSKTDVVKVLAYNASGDLIKTVTVKLTDSAALQGTVTPNKFELGTDLRVAGTYTGGVKKVALQVNGETFTGVGVLADGTFTYYAKDKVLSKTDVVKVIAYNANNQVVDTKTVTVTDSSSNVESKVTPATFKIGDARVTGTQAGAVKKVGLEINGTVHAYVPVVDATTFQYYAKNLILSDTDEVYVIGYDSANQQVAKSKVTVTK
ncbi:autolysin modifier protein, partial [Listeria weihenstephanensis]